MKALRLPVSEKNFEDRLLCSYVTNCAPSPTRRCYVPNIKALGLPVSKKKNFEIFFLCSYVPTCDPLDRASFGPRGIK